MTGYEATAHVDVAAPPERVWQALTDPDEVAQYMYGSRVSTDWRPGSAITWSGSSTGSPTRTRGRCWRPNPAVAWCSPTSAP